jgi:hypothetical protein
MFEEIYKFLEFWKFRKFYFLISARAHDRVIEPIAYFFSKWHIRWMI